MAQELSQAELLDFLCQAGGRVANAALLAHFKRFLRDPQAGPGQLQHRRHLFKGFVNSVATVSQDGPGAATYVVLKKRYRDLVGEVEPGPASERSPLQPARWDRSGESAGDASPRESPQLRRREEAENGGRWSDGEAAAAGRRKAGRCLSPASPGVGSRAPPPAKPTLGCLKGEKKGPRQPLAEPAGPDWQEKAPRCSNGLGLPVGEMGPLPNGGSAQQRIRDWIVTHHAASPEQPFQPLEACQGPAWSQSSDWSSCRPCGSLDWGPRSESSEGWLDPPVPVFRSIRCRLSLQDLEDHLEQESSTNEEGSSASRESGSHPREGAAAGRANSAGHEGPGDAPHGNGVEATMPFVMPLVQDSKPPPHVALLRRIVGRAATMGKTEGKDLLKPKARKTGRLPCPYLDAPLSPRLVLRPKPVANAPLVEKLASNPDDPAVHRSSLVPLEGREHTWLVKIATGSWMQVRALLQEDPYLVLHRDFVSGFTVLHWLAEPNQTHI
ncbi:ankyrin repeat domain-containing protein SOWAHB [Ahaetulla prasina]|uniref:ankyrin repeat domain-containing protein SOWAHB n=1 Tax=Ahaetulla prasina TaxID=499056 RepID=UPI0026499421|nr:ankyrin repeat domain-containing protein SOWAHB [Ahaetulla prasina]